MDDILTYGSWCGEHPEAGVPERYLAFWLCVHARLDGLPQQEYTARQRRGYALWRTYPMTSDMPSPQQPLPPFSFDEEFY